MRVKKPVKEIVLNIPPPIESTKQWLIIGIDPSLSRTGYALLHVSPEDGTEGTTAKWMGIGSLKPESSSDPDWVRSKAMGLCLKKIIMDAASFIYDSRAYDSDKDVGLIISFEYPTTMNTHLTSLNRILKLIMLDAELQSQFSTVRIQETNAATLRSLMGLKMKGSKNKALENIPKAYTFVDKAKYPELDTDSCDGVLLAMMARHTASIMLGSPPEVPENFLNRLCDSSQEMKGKGRNMRILIRGLLHRPEYFYSYTPRTVTIKLKDASMKTKKLSNYQFLL